MWKPLIYHNENLGKYYEISEEGIIKNLRTEEYVNNYISGKGYYYAYLGFDGERKGINIRVHIAVAETFIPNPESKPQVCHKDGNKLNINTNNLFWTTGYENMQHAKELKLMKNKTVAIKCIELNKTFDSITEAAEFILPENPIQAKKNISRALKRENNETYGYHWKYVA